jgi:hypothetical protein
MYQRYPTPCDESMGCKVSFTEIKYFEEDIIGENVDRYLVYEILDQSAAVVDTGIVKIKNTNREMVPHKGFLPRDHASRCLQRSRHPDSKFQWC